MGRFRKPGEFRRWNEGDVARASSSNNHRFLLIYHLIKDGGEVLTETGVRRLGYVVSLGIGPSIALYGNAVPTLNSILRAVARHKRTRRHHHHAPVIPHL